MHCRPAHNPSGPTSVAKANAEKGTLAESLLGAA